MCPARTSSHLSVARPVRPFCLELVPCSLTKHRPYPNWKNSSRVSCLNTIPQLPKIHLLVMDWNEVDKRLLESDPGSTHADQLGALSHFFTSGSCRAAPLK